MTTRTDYTETEWNLLTALPRLAAFGAMAAEQGGPFSSTRELLASMIQLGHSPRSRYASNALIQEIMSAYSQPDEGEEMKFMGVNIQDGEQLGGSIVELSLEKAARVGEILTNQSMPDEADEYIEWVLGIARAGCQAVRSGPFGLGGDAVTPAEEQYIKDLSRALDPL